MDKITFRREPPRFAANHSHRVSPRTTVVVMILCNVKSYIILHRDTRAPQRAGGVRPDARDY